MKTKCSHCTVSPGGVLAAKCLIPSSNFFGHLVMFCCPGNFKLSMFVLLLHRGFKVYLIIQILRGCNVNCRIFLQQIPLLWYGIYYEKLLQLPASRFKELRALYVSLYVHAHVHLLSFFGEFDGNMINDHFSQHSLLQNFHHSKSLFRHPCISICRSIQLFVDHATQIAEYCHHYDGQPHIACWQSLLTFILQHTKWPSQSE